LLHTVVLTPVATALQVNDFFYGFTSMDFKGLGLLHAVYYILYTENKAWEHTGIAGQRLSHIIHLWSCSVQLICETRL